uniref:Uncharacterized protein n=1 Tax=Arundo donax TaxID=35708 RepID=A0A0A9GL19_ARUDO
MFVVLGCCFVRVCVCCKILFFWCSRKRYCKFELLFRI